MPEIFKIYYFSKIMILIILSDRQVGELYEEGSRKARSSDSSRRTRLSHRTHRSWLTAANTSFASNIQKMFSEKIEVFSPVDASKVE